MPSCSAAAFELACHVAVRSKTFYGKAFVTGLAAVTLCIILIPLFMTDTPSYGAARKACYDQSFDKWNATHWAEGPRYRPEWSMDDDANRDLFPAHLFNSISTVVSLFGFGVWLFFSSHQSDVAKDLDRTRTCTDIPDTFFFLHSNRIAPLVPPHICQWAATLPFNGWPMLSSLEQHRLGLVQHHRQWASFWPTLLPCPRRLACLSLGQIFYAIVIFWKKRA